MKTNISAYNEQTLNIELSPICLFTYARHKETVQTVNALQKNKLAGQSDLFVFSDAPKNQNNVDDVNKVRTYLKQIKGFKSVTIFERQHNYGLAKSIIDGVSQVINEYGKVIVLEDDLITSINFLSYMNSSLAAYDNEPKVWSVSGFSFPIKYPPNYKYDVAFGVRASSWGWATWSDRWNTVDWQVSDYEDFCKDKKALKRFNQGGSDMVKMLDNQMRGKIDSWAIRFCYAQFKQGAFDVFPTVSKIQNVGFNVDATNTKGMDLRFGTNIDTDGKTNFAFSKEFKVEPKILHQFRKPFSIITRIKYKIIRLLK